MARKSGSDDKAEARAARLKAALKANMQKRKAQARARSDDGSTKAGKDDG